MEPCPSRDELLLEFHTSDEMLRGSALAYWAFDGDFVWKYNAYDLAEERGLTFQQLLRQLLATCTVRLAREHCAQCPTPRVVRSRASVQRRDAFVCDACITREAERLQAERFRAVEDARRLEEALHAHHARAVRSWNVARIDPFHCLVLIAVLRAGGAREDLQIGVPSRFSRFFVADRLAQSLLTELYDKDLITAFCIETVSHSGETSNGAADDHESLKVNVLRTAWRIPADATTTSRSVIEAALISRVSSCTKQLLPEAARIYNELAIQTCVRELGREADKGRPLRIQITECIRGEISNALLQLPLDKVQSICIANMRYAKKKFGCNALEASRNLPNILRHCVAMACDGQWKFLENIIEDGGVLLVTLEELLGLDDPFTLREGLDRNPFCVPERGFTQYESPLSPARR
jgi:hypothetical protein